MRFHEGIDAQPQALRRSADTVRDALTSLPPLPPDALVALVGIGASEHVARSAALTWRRLGLRAFAVSASELLEPAVVGATVHVGISESGRSAETVAAFRNVGGRRVAVTNFPGSVLAELADDVLPLGSGPDSPVYTTGYTATLQAVAMLGEHWAGAAGEWARLPGQVEDVLASVAPTVQAVAESFDSARIIDVVATGPSVATAGEGALLLREASRAHTAAHETYNYLHGPMEPIESDAAAIVVGDGREIRLALDLSRLGCRTLLITRRHDVDPAPGLTVIPLPGAGSPLADAVLEIVPIQLLGRTLTDRRGLLADGFRYEQDDTKLAVR